VLTKLSPYAGTTSPFVSFSTVGKARCSVPGEDCGPRREEPLPYRSGRVRCLRRSL
jgi:hypothetical protein